MRSILAFVLTAIALIGCAPMPRELAVDTDEATYGRLFPTYAELCALSEIDKKKGAGVDIGSGGPGGHAVLYLNGVCRDRGAGYPTLTMCDPPTSNQGAADQGVGLSVNAHYRNTVWVATQGRALFFDGGLGPRARLDRLAYDRAQAQAKAQGVFDGVEFQPETFDNMPAASTRRDHMYELSIGTDYAVGFARHRYCARVPLERAEMARVVDYLNDANRPYKAGQATFEWDVFRQNCSHVLHDALAAAGVWEPRDVPDFFVFAALVFPVPKNEFVNLMTRTNDLPLDDAAALYDDDGVRAAVLAGTALPTRPGAIATATPVVEDNEIYNTALRLIHYDRPWPFERFPPRFARIFAEPRYSNLRANLADFAQRYRRAAAEAAAPGTTPADPGLAAFRARYAAALERARRAVEAELATLSGPTTAQAVGPAD